MVWWTELGDPDATTSFRRRVDETFRQRLPSEWRGPRETPCSLRVDDRIEELTTGGWFGDVHHEMIRSSHRMNASGVRALFSTFPGIANLDPDERNAFFHDLGAAVETEGGEIDDPFVTVIYAARNLAVRP